VSLVEENVSGDAADRVRARRGGVLTPLDRLLLHSPPVADGWNALLGAVRSRTTVRPDVRELVICRIAALNAARYEWAAHAPLALANGVSPAQLDAIRDGRTDILDPVQKSAVEYASAMTRDVEVPDELFEELRWHFDERGVVELTATIAAYNLVSRFLVALRLEPTAPEEEAAGAGTRPGDPA
jgi:alkylhydroperoxidase family enzyme